VENINRSKGFVVLADETTDVSKVEQMSICARYLCGGGGTLREDFLLFVPVTDLTGSGLARVIIDNLKKLGIDLKYLFGQGYDGAPAMNARFQGAQAHVREENPLAIAMHYGSHSFNLAISDACSLPIVIHCMAVIQSSYTFFVYPKRLNVLVTTIKLVSPTEKATRLVALCPTRWVERHTSKFLDLQVPRPSSGDRQSAGENHRNMD